MRIAIKIFLSALLTIMLTLPALAYGGDSKSPHGDLHKDGSKKPGGHHGYGRPKGPPADIPAHIKSRTNKDGTGVNLNNSLVGIEGVTFMASAPEYKNVVSLALKRNRLGDDGVKVLSQSDTFKHVELLSLWENGVTAGGAEMVASSANFRNLKDLNLASNHIGDDGVQSLANSANLKNVTSLDLSANQITDKGAAALANSPHLANDDILFFFLIFLIHV